jgi:hypothetical protein
MRVTSTSHLRQQEVKHWVHFSKNIGWANLKFGSNIIYIYNTILWPAWISNHSCKSFVNTSEVYEPIQFNVNATRISPCFINMGVPATIGIITSCWGPLSWWTEALLFLGWVDIDPAPTKINTPNQGPQMNKPKIQQPLRLELFGGNLFLGEWCSMF